MANADNPTGLKLIGALGCSVADLSINPYVIASGDATVTYVGDVVKLAAGTDTTGKLRTVVQGTASAAHVGVVTGFKTDFDNLSRNYRTTLTERIAYVCDDPRAIYVAQEDSVGGAIAYTGTDFNADIIVGSGSTTTGLSGMEIDSNTAATTNTLDLKILGLYDVPNNAIGTNAKWKVMLNRHQNVNQVAGA